MCTRVFYTAKGVATVHARLSKVLTSEALVGFISPVGFDFNRNVEKRDLIEYLFTVRIGCWVFKYTGNFRTELTN